MHEPGGVDGREGTADVLADQDRFTRVQGTVREQRGFERLPADELHAETDAAAVRLDAEHADDVGMPNLRQRATFPQEPLRHRRVRHDAVEDL